MLERWENPSGKFNLGLGFAPLKKHAWAKEGAQLTAGNASGDVRSVSQSVDTGLWKWGQWVQGGAGLTYSWAPRCLEQGLDACSAPHAARACSRQVFEMPNYSWWGRSRFLLSFPSNFKSTTQKVMCLTPCSYKNWNTGEKKMFGMNIYASWPCLLLCCILCLSAVKCASLLLETRGRKPKKYVGCLASHWENLY